MPIYIHMQRKMHTETFWSMPLSLLFNGYLEFLPWGGKVAGA